LEAIPAMIDEIWMRT